MTADRMKELDKLIMEEEFSMEKYKPLSLEEANYLHQQALIKRDTMKDKEKEKFNMKAEFFYFLSIEKLKEYEQFYVAFFAQTNMPFTTCDEKTFDDEVWIFTDQEQLKDTIAKYEEKNIKLREVGVKKEQYLHFFTTMFYLGINAVLVNPDTDNIQFLVEKICIKPDWEKEENKAEAIANPELQLTMMYFMQEYHQNTEGRNNKKLVELEEEMLANLLKGKYILPTLKPEEGETGVKIPYLSNHNKEIFMPVFTDIGEFAKYNLKQQYQVAVVSFAEAAKMVGEELKGLVVNPFGSNLMILHENLTKLLNVVGEK